MCSIAGSKSSIEVNRMLAAQSHRGPDDSSYLDFPDIGFCMGMNRLSIIDLESSNLCPRKQGRYVLSYNGEVYNYLELKKELITYGIKFETTSDTEVVLAAFEKWGVKSFNKFNGMFAIAILDTQEGKIYLARDIAGQKPLFYREGKSFAFSSEAKALVNEDTPPQEDTFFDIFQHIYTGTLYKNIYQLKPAHYLVHDIRNNTSKIDRYWEFSPRYINRETALEELEHLLTDAVSLVQRSHVPTALYYSQGLDSSIIKSMGKFEDYFTYDIEGTSKEDFYNTIETIVKHLDFPVGSLSSYPLFKLSEMANQKGIKVVVSGEGADEIFGGYVRYVPVASDYQMIRRYPSYWEMFNKNRHPNYTALTNRKPGGENFIARHMQPFFKEHDPVTAMQLFDFTYILPSLLQMGDRMASAHSVENRCPYLDKRVIEFGLSLPIDMKINNYETKVLLRKLASELEVRENQSEKHGLVIPFNKWHGVEGYDRSLYFQTLKDIWVKQNS